MKKKYLVSFFIYFFLLNLSLNPIYSFIWLALLFVIMIIAVFFLPNHGFLFPFYIYPFALIIKHQNPESLLISFLPSLTIFIAIMFFLFNRKIYLYKKNLFYFLSLFVVLITLNNFLHVLEIFFLPALIKQYILPILFMIIFINASLKKNELPLEALKICICSFSITSIIALLSHFGFIKKIILHPDSGARSSVICLNEKVRTFFCSETDFFPRVDPLISGSIGSAAAILLTLSIVSIFLCDRTNRLKYFSFFSLPLFAVSFLSLSVSILISIAYLLLIIAIRYKFFKPSILILIIFFVIFFITKFNIFLEYSPYAYFLSTIVNTTLNHFANVELINIFFGSGPIIDSLMFKYYPKNYLIDAGIFRVAVENGIFIFIFLLAIIFYILNKAFWLVINFPSNFNLSLLFILLVSLSIVHSNAFFTYPFFILLVIAVSGIIVQYKLKK